MKKIIQICSLLSLIVLFTVVSASAQSYGSEVNIPFAFNVGDQSYESGDYMVRLEKLATGAATLSIQDVKTEEVHKVLMNASGDAASGEVKLMFDTINGQRYLTKISTPDRAYAVIKSKTERDASQTARNKAKEGAGVGVSN